MDVELGLDWLSRVALDHRGAVPSWVNEAHPGYAYPEAAGLVLTVLAQSRARDPAVPAIVAWLEPQVGAIGRGGVRYAFDTAMVLTGLLAAERAGVAVQRSAIARAFEVLAEAIAERRAATPEQPPRWSTRWSCHQLKLAWALSAYDARFDSAPARASLERLVELATLERDGRFALRQDDPRTYVHAGCYALEGLLALRRRGEPVDDTLHRGCEWLASIQSVDGTLPAWVGREDPRRPSDVVAQSLRLWSAVDRDRHAEAIARARSALARRQAPSGGIRYDEHSDDLNTWSTAFAVQACRWWADGPAPAAWIA